MTDVDRSRIRILMAKPGLDGHVVGLLQVSRALKDAGYEVIMGGVRRTPEQIVKMAIDEDVNVIGLSILSGAHMSLCPRVVDLLRERGASDILVMVGGVVPPQDAEKLLERGVSACFGPGSMIKDICRYIDAHAPSYSVD